VAARQFARGVCLSEIVVLRRPDSLPAWRWDAEQAALIRDG